MNLNNCRTLLTGASGGIGRHLAVNLAKQGAKLILVGRRIDALNTLRDDIMRSTGHESVVIAADISQSEGRQSLLDQIRRRVGGVDLLINNAGITDFHVFNEQDPEVINRIFQTNVIAPIQLIRALLPDMLAQNQGRIVNIGSTFGSIGFAYFSTYSSSKFAIRGFSESLRRELDGTGVEVCYLAPRAVKTTANSEAVYRMAEATNMHMDEPEEVADFIVKSITKDKVIAYYGWPEKLFVRINALLPRFVDNALRKQNRIISQFSSRS